MTEDAPTPLLRDKRRDAPSAFTPENLLREARRQNGAAPTAIPELCLLDPDGDIVRRLRAEGRARRDPGWACWHTELWRFELDGRDIGAVACAVGAPFAVLVAEQMFASGCRRLVSLTSAGRIAPDLAPPCFILIDRALRDEGTSLHYLPASDWCEAPAALLAALDGLCGVGPAGLPPLRRGASWTTDAPFRETEAAIEAARARGVLAVEMEAAGLYAFAAARGREVICIAHVTNQMGTVEGDFEKGAAGGTDDALALLARIAALLAEADLPARPGPA